MDIYYKNVFLMFLITVSTVLDVILCKQPVVPITRTASKCNGEAGITTEKKDER